MRKLGCELIDKPKGSDPSRFFVTHRGETRFIVNPAPRESKWAELALGAIIGGVAEGACRQVPDPRTYHETFSRAFFHPWENRAQATLRFDAAGIRWDEEVLMIRPKAVHVPEDDWSVYPVPGFTQLTGIWEGYPATWGLSPGTCGDVRTPPSLYVRNPGFFLEPAWPCLGGAEPETMQLVPRGQVVYCTTRHFDLTPFVEAYDCRGNPKDYVISQVLTFLHTTERNPLAHFDGRMALQITRHMASLPPPHGERRLLAGEQRDQLSVFYDRLRTHGTDLWKTFSPIREDFPKGWEKEEISPAMMSRVIELTANTTVDMLLGFTGDEAVSLGLTGNLWWLTFQLFLDTLKVCFGRQPLLPLTVEIVQQCWALIAPCLRWELPEPPAGYRPGHVLDTGKFDWVTVSSHLLSQQEVTRPCVLRGTLSPTQMMIKTLVNAEQIFGLDYRVLEIEYRDVVTMDHVRCDAPGYIPLVESGFRGLPIKHLPISEGRWAAGYTTEGTRAPPQTQGPVAFTRADRSTPVPGCYYMGVIAGEVMRLDPSVLLVLSEPVTYATAVIGRSGCFFERKLTPLAGKIYSDGGSAALLTPTSAQRVIEDASFIFLRVTEATPLKGVRMAAYFNAMMVHHVTTYGRLDIYPSGRLTYPDPTHGAAYGYLQLSRWTATTKGVIATPPDTIHLSSLVGIPIVHTDGFKVRYMAWEDRTFVIRTSEPIYVPASFNGAKRREAERALFLQLHLANPAVVLDGFVSSLLAQWPQVPGSLRYISMWMEARARGRDIELPRGQRPPSRKAWWPIFQAGVLTGLIHPSEEQLALIARMWYEVNPDLYEAPVPLTMSGKGGERVKDPVALPHRTGIIYPPKRSRTPEEHRALLKRLNSSWLGVVQIVRLDYSVEDSQLLERSLVDRGRLPPGEPGPPCDIPKNMERVNIVSFDTMGTCYPETGWVIDKGKKPRLVIFSVPHTETWGVDAISRGGEIRTETARSPFLPRNYGFKAGEARPGFCFTPGKKGFKIVEATLVSIRTPSEVETGWDPEMTLFRNWRNDIMSGMDVCLSLSSVDRKSPEAVLHYMETVAMSGCLGTYRRWIGPLEEHPLVVEAARLNRVEVGEVLVHWDQRKMTDLAFGNYLSFALNLGRPMRWVPGPGRGGTAPSRHATSLATQMAWVKRPYDSKKVVKAFLDLVSWTDQGKRWTTLLEEEQGVSLGLHRVWSPLREKIFLNVTHAGAVGSRVLLTSGDYLTLSRGGKGAEGTIWWEGGADAASSPSEDHG